MRSYPYKRIIKLTMYPKVTMAVPLLKYRRYFITKRRKTMTLKSCASWDIIKAIRYVDTVDLIQHFPSKLKVHINRCLFVTVKSVITWRCWTLHVLRITLSEYQTAGLSTSINHLCKHMFMAFDTTSFLTVF